MVIASWIVLALTSASLVVLAVRSQGVPVHKADLNNGGVWVTNSSLGQLARENKPIRQLDLDITGAAHASDNIDVLQNKEAVIAFDRSDDLLTPVDTSQGTADPKNAVTVKSPDVHLGGRVVAVTDPQTGKVWAAQMATSGGASALDALDATAKPLAIAGAGAAVTVAQTGEVFAISTVTRRVTSFSPRGDGWSKPASGRLTSAPSGALHLTTVGSTLVWLDSNGVLGFKGRHVNVGKGAVLQQNGPVSSAVLVETTSKLLSVDLDSGKVSTLGTNTSGTSSAAPVELGGCAWGLWSSSSSAYVTQSCGGASSSRPPFPVRPGAELVYRINRTSLLVNDLTTGEVWDVDGAKAEQIADWQSLNPKQDKPNKDTKTVQSQEPAKPDAVKDDLGARAGDTTVLHVLDNDKAPKGTTLAITDDKNANQQLAVTIAPDQQSLLARVDAGVPSGTVLSFSYTIDDGEAKNSTAAGTVDLTVHAPDDTPAQPTLRDNYAESKPPTYPVASDESIDIPVLADWRDKTDGDPVSLVPGSAKANRGTVSITPDGLLRYAAPALGGKTHSIPVQISYETSTGGAPGAGSTAAEVYAGTATAPAIAQPDVAAGEVGSPIVIHPLDNDVAGADPVDPTATLHLAANVPPQPGLTVATDRAAGTVTVVGKRPGSYVLPYRAGYGSATTEPTSNIRVLVKPSSKTSGAPVAMPDTTTLHGSSPMTVDVLANDYDPQGRLLAVQQATQTSGGGTKLDVAVINGRWIRVSNPGGEESAKPEVVDYVVSNGHQPVTGTLTVALRGPIDPATDAPDAEPDAITVRAGTSAVIPVLDNDSTPSGAPVGIVAVPGVTPGTIPVTSGPGTAYLDGKYVRFDAPSDVKTTTTTYVSYTVENTSDPDAGRSSTEITVRITPPPNPRTNPDQAPTPSEIDGRVVEGDSVTMRLPLTGQDPDGDPVTVTGIGDPSVAASTPRFGQVVGSSADSITYRAFPGQTGEDQFSYVVSDPSGETATGTVRVAVISPGAPQAPVAVDDSVTADPSRTLRIEVLANDLFPQGTTPSVEKLRGPPTGVSESADQLVIKPVSRGTALTVPYAITNGLAQSSAKVLLHFQKGFDNPPVAGAVTASPDAQARAVTAKVLAKVTDIDDDRQHLSLVSVDGIAASSIHGGAVTLPVSAQPRVWTYHVRDAEGALAVGNIYEAGRPTDVPYLKKGSVLYLPSGATTIVHIAKYVLSPKTGTQPYLTTDDQIFTSPTARFSGEPRTPNQQSIKLTTTKGSGPGALTFQVSDEKDFNSRTATTAVITIPVVVGHPEPVLACPTEPIQVPDSGNQSVRIAAVCHVWQDANDAKSLTYGVKQVTSVPQVTARSDGSRMTITANHARPGRTGSIQITVDGYHTTAALKFLIVKLPPPTLVAIPVQHPHAGQSVSVDLAPYLQSGVPASAFEPAVLSVDSTNGGAKASLSGRDHTTVSIQPPPNEHLTYTYTVTMSDSGLHASSDRRVTGTLRVQVTDVPHWPGGAAPSVVGTLPQSTEVTLHWPGAIPYGTPVTGYVVRSAAGDKQCGSTTCTITGLKNGTTYSFTVTAQSADGPSKSIGPVSALPDAVPTAVTNLHVVSERSGHVTYVWNKPVGKFGPVTGYLLSGTGLSGYTQSAQATRTVAVPNGEPLTFTARPINELYARTGKFGPPATNTLGVASGKPSSPSITGVTGANVAGGGTKAFTVSWGQVDPNGRGNAHYELSDNGAPVTCNGAQWTGETHCSEQVPNNGAQHSYTVVAANDAGVPASANASLEGSTAQYQSAPSGARSVRAIGTPNGFSNASLTPTGNTGEATLKFTVGASNGPTGTVKCSGSFSCSVDVGKAGGTFTRTITGLDDGSTSNGTLTYCNGGTTDAGLDEDPCTTTTVSAVTFGPIGDPSISTSANGQTITVSTNVDANGASASVTIRNNTNGDTHGCGSSDSRNFPCSWSDSGLNYSTTYSYTVTVSDASGHGRSSKSASKSDSTGAAPPPPVSVSVRKGPKRVVTGGDAACTHSPGCASIETTTSLFTSNVSCHVTASSKGLGGFITWTQGANATRDGPDVQQSGSVTVQCTDGAGHTASGTGSW